VANAPQVLVELFGVGNREKTYEVPTESDDKQSIKATGDAAAECSCMGGRNTKEGGISSLCTNGVEGGELVAKNGVGDESGGEGMGICLVLACLWPEPAGPQRCTLEPRAAVLGEHAVDLRSIRRHVAQTCRG